MIGYCDHHLHPDMIIDLDTFEWKGCWTCYHFNADDDFPFMDVNDTSNELNISRSTVIRWVKSGKLKGRLFERGRHVDSISPPYKKYFIDKDSVESQRMNSPR